MLIYSDTVRVFPVESVYGIIEVKSRMSKPKFEEAFQNIVAFKKMAPNEPVVARHGLWTITCGHQKPFWAIFAYSLDKNSINSLKKNLVELERNTDPILWRY